MDDPYLFKKGVDRVVQRCEPKYQAKQVLESCHSSPYGGQHGEECTTYIVLLPGFFCIILCKYSFALFKECDQCQIMGTTFIRHEIPQNNILKVDIF